MENIEETSVESPQILSIEDRGIIARKAGGKITIFNRENSELFSFAANACSFESSSIQFLFDVYRTGFERGKMIGREMGKERIRELLRTEL